jgi:SAM-dependent methyltransferase
VLASFLERFINSSGNDASQLYSIEIGSGSCPLPSMVLSKCGVITETTDGSQDALNFSKSIFEDNGLNGYNLSVFNWNNPVPVDWVGKFDFLVASDVIYMSRNIPCIIKVIARCLKKNGMAIIVDPGRCFCDSFVDACQGYHQ